MTSCLSIVLACWPSVQSVHFFQILPWSVTASIQKLGACERVSVASAELGPKPMVVRSARSMLAKGMSIRKPKPSEKMYQTKV